MRILITGGNGVLGRPLTKRLREQQHMVFTCGRSHGEHPQHIRADVNERRQVDRLFEITQPDLVCHFAAEFGRNNGEDYYEQLWRTNTLGLANVIDACMESSAHLVFASSSEAYGRFADQTMLREGLLDGHCPDFHNNYALTKYVGEQQIKTAVTKYGLHANILRFFNVYGPGEHYTPYRSVVCQFIYKAMKGLPTIVYGDTSRSLLYIDDWTDAVTAVIADCRITKFPQALNIASDETTNMADLMQNILNKIGPSTPSTKVTMIDTERGNVAHKQVSIDLARTFLGWTPKVGIDEGLDRTIRWMKGIYG